MAIFWLFTAFILACGLTHLMDAVIFWWPAYRLSAVIRFSTAIISWVTVFALVRIIPKALQMKTPEELEVIINKRTADLNRANNEMKEMTLDLMAYNKRLEDFTSITSHNLRSPVSNMSGLLALYHREPTTEKKAELVQKLQVVVSHLTDTLDDLSEVLKVKTKNTEPPESVEIMPVFNRVRESLVNQIDECHALIEADFDDAPNVYINRAYLESILMNLFSNALRYRSPERKPHIRFRTYTEDNITVLKVSDNGLGINMERHGAKLFGLHKTFHKNPDARGLGLFLVKAQAESAGGDVRAESRENVGTTFTVQFGKTDRHDK
ncbi:MAG: HAMP domain-containing sensor histidine kinase [Bacteroidota bacterium]